MRIVLLSVIPAVVVCGLIMLVAWRPWRRAAKRGEWGAPLGLGAAMVTAYLCSSLAMDSTLPGWLPRERWRMIGIISIAATTFGLIGASWRPRGWERKFLAAVTGACVAGLVQPTPGVANPIAHKIVVGLVALVLCANLESLAHRRPGATVPLALSAVFCGAAALFMQSGFARLSLLAGAMALSLATIALMARWSLDVNLCDGGMLWLGAVLSALLGMGSDAGYNTGEAPMASFVLIAAAPLMLWPAEMKWAQRLRPANAAVVRIALVSVPVVIALALTWPFTLPPM